MSADQELAMTGAPSMVLGILGLAAAALGGLFVKMSRKGADTRKNR